VTLKARKGEVQIEFTRWISLQMLVPDGRPMNLAAAVEKHSIRRSIGGKKREAITGGSVPT